MFITGKTKNPNTSKKNTAERPTGRGVVQLVTYEHVDHKVVHSIVD